MANFFKDVVQNYIKKNAQNLDKLEDYNPNHNTGVDHSAIDFVDGKNLTRKEAIKEKIRAGIDVGTENN